ncbi:sugar phosphate isomerase/epimerase [Arcicella aurantiaca]|jgi:sugar phosphate isomerase/epimerase|uniref:Sugar phosphate isomerase/epimerase n=1 Tax=Arcicella aurantiaca TaxID=591202 RepID=A0A316EFC7_9BACT|nr:sugar phosphate isomerase/epimerase [Arcicella aurantiaca]PWK21620.1 sugar phosphate isomerase/epimerase [Arcicella aurantiaca]
MRNTRFFRLLSLSILMSLSLSVFAQKKWGGMTLYTVRAEMGKDAKATLKEVADLGYKYIEAVDYKDGKFYGMAPEEFNSYLKSLGLQPISVHMGSMTTDNADKLIADVKAAGFKYFIAPVPPMGMFKFDPKTRKLGMEGTMEKLAEILNTVAVKAHAAGLEFLYHNHDFEFQANQDGVVPIDYLLEHLDPKYVNFQMDLYWVTKAGADPVAYFKRYPGRFKIWHVKDMDSQQRFAPVGQGTIDFKRILANKKLSGMKYYIVEQDQTFDGLQPMDALKISKQGLTKYGFH